MNTRRLFVIHTYEEKSMPKVMKFGGSSLSDYRCFKRAAQSIKSCGAETVVVSAPGKRYKADEKITDLLKKADNHGIFSRRYRTHFLRFDSLYSCLLIAARIVSLHFPPVIRSC